MKTNPPIPNQRGGGAIDPARANQGPIEIDHLLVRKAEVIPKVTVQPQQPNDVRREDIIGFGPRRPSAAESSRRAHRAGNVVASPSAA